MKLSNYKLDPWQFITSADLAQTCNKVFDMSENTIGVLGDNYIKSSNEVFELIDYFRSQGESIPEQQYKIRTSESNYIVNGFNPISNTICEYNGCYFYGFKSCYNKYTQNSINMKYMKELYKEWNKKKNTLIKEGYNLVEMWSHNWNEMKSTNTSVKDFIQAYDKVSLFLDPREAFFGGMTQPAKLYKKVNTSENERIRNVDYTSLYPTINFFRARGITSDTLNKIEEWYYPTGHPIRIRENFKDISEYFSFIKCKITTSKNLYCPLLPMKS